MKNFNHILVFFLTLFFTTESFADLSKDMFWTHLELGAGNYGLDGHTKASQEKTVLMKVKTVTSEKNYTDDLQACGRGNYNPEEQYVVLFSTLDELVSRYGKVGVFHVNDLYEEYAIYAAEQLREYARKQGYESVIIEAISGDYSNIDVTKTLSAFGKDHYFSMHLKNPEVSFYHDCIDGDHFYTSDEARYETRTLLQNLANQSETGLYLFILYHENFIPAEERIEFIENDWFYHHTYDWQSVPYVFPEGEVIEKEIGRVFHILPGSIK